MITNCSQVSDQLLANTNRKQ